MVCHTVREDEGGYLHIPSPVDGYLSLCGWVDVEYEVVEGRADCPVCIEVVEHCREMDFTI